MRQLQQSCKSQRPEEQNLRRARRTSSRRSAYAFSHQEGFGELITSGKNMRTSRVSSTCSYERTAPSSKWIENVIKRTNAVSCISFGSPNKQHQSLKQPDRLNCWWGTLYRNPCEWTPSVSTSYQCPSLGLAHAQIKNTNIPLFLYQVI